MNADGLTLLCSIKRTVVSGWFRKQLIVEEEALAPMFQDQGKKEEPSAIGRFNSQEIKFFSVSSQEFKRNENSS